MALVVLVATGIFVFSTSRRGGGSAALNSALKADAELLKKLQAESNTARASVSKAFDLLDKELNLIGKPGGAGLAEATTAWIDGPKLMNEARDANLMLPKIAVRIVKVAAEGRTEIRKLYATLGRGADRKYAQALDLALESLINTQVKYSKVDGRLARGFPDYDSLYNRTDKFFKELNNKTYRTPAEASQVYSLATSPLVEPLATLRKDLNKLEIEAAQSGKKTLEAFNKAARLRPAA
ncbi:MAG: hypothetical protein ACR2FO_03985 [Actinomycetota bacterium]